MINSADEPHDPKRVVSFWLSPELVAGLDEIAARRNDSRNTIVREALTALVESSREPVRRSPLSNWRR